MVLSKFKKDEIYTLVSPLYYPMFNRICEVLADRGFYTGEIIEKSDAYFAQNVDFVFYHNGNKWIVSDTPPLELRLSLIKDYFGEFLMWLNDEIVEGMKEIMNIMVDAVIERYKLVKPSFYIRVGNDPIMTVVHNESFDNITVRDFNTLKNELLTNAQEILELFSPIKVIEIYSYINEDRDIVVKF